MNTQSSIEFSKAWIAKNPNIFLERFSAFIMDHPATSWDHEISNTFGFITVTANRKIES